MIEGARIMGKKRRAPTSCSPSGSTTKKLAVQNIDGRPDTADADDASIKPEMIPTCNGSSGDRGPNTIESDDEELQLIESTMVELLIQRGPEKTC